MFDIHSHILPAVDDGAKTPEESIALLEALKSQGVTDVMATPHFYPHEDNLSEFTKKTAEAYRILLEAVSGKEMPNIYLGCEILYFEGMGHSQSLGELCLNGSSYLLIELTDECIRDSLMTNIKYLKDNSDIIPIIAHVERYYRSKNYRKFIKFLKKENIIVQINASSILERAYERIIQKLIKAELRIIIGSDAHSVAIRPPKLDKALSTVAQKYGKQCYDRILRNMNIIFKNIVTDGDF